MSPGKAVSVRTRAATAESFAVSRPASVSESGRPALVIARASATEIQAPVKPLAPNTAMSALAAAIRGTWTSGAARSARAQPPSTASASASGPLVTVITPSRVSPPHRGKPRATSRLGLRDNARFAPRRAYYADYEVN